MLALEPAKFGTQKLPFGRGARSLITILIGRARRLEQPAERTRNDGLRRRQRRRLLSRNGDGGAASARLKHHVA